MRKEVIPLTEQKRKQKNDAIFIAALFLVFAVVGALFLIFGKKGDTVIVTVDKAVYGEYPLHRDTTVEIRSQGSCNLLIIRDGCAFVESASCPDGICVSHKPISLDGESIICLPNKVVISVSSENKPDMPA